MKKSLFFFIFLLLAINVFSADLIFGAIGGVNLGWFSGDDWNDYVDYLGAESKAKMGYNIGLFLDILINNNLSIQPEILYTSFGGKLASEDQYLVDYDIYVDEELIFTVNSITLPILVKYKIDAGDYFEAGSGKIALFAGPVFYLITKDINVKYKLSSTGYYPYTEKGNIEADNKTVLGMTLGIGYNIPLMTGAYKRKGEIIIDLRYYRFLTGLFEDDDQRSNYVGVNIGYGIGL